MSRLALLSDIHANLHALKAVLEEVAACEADALAVAGDIVGYGAEPAACVDVLQRLGADAVLGNHDAYAVAIDHTGQESLPPGWDENPVMAGVVHAVSQLSAEQFRWLATRPWVHPLDPDTVLAHSSLHEPECWHYLLSEDDARPTWAVMRERKLSVAFFGHTHHLNVFADPEAAAPVRQSDDGWVLPAGTRCAVTVGSVGQPRGAGHDPRATWALWDSETRTLEFKRTAYPHHEAAGVILEAGLPEMSAGRLLLGV